MAEWPRNLTDQLNWSQAHISNFTTNAVAIGITVVEANEFQAATDAALLAYNEQKAAQQVAKEKTLALRIAMGDLHDQAAAIIRSARNKAETTDNPNVYVLAGISPAAPPTPAPAPSAPTALSASLTNAGGVELSWKAAKRNASFFSVWRRLVGESTFGLVGMSDTKSFQDNSLPQGATYATYYVRAHRGDLKSDASESINIFFGEIQQAA